MEEQYQKRLLALQLSDCEELHIKFLKIESNTCIQISRYVAFISE